MVPLPPDRQRVQDLDGPPKPLLLPKSPETKLTTSMMGDGIGRIQLHNPGKTNVKANILSRRVDHNRGEDDNKDITVLKDEWFRRIETIQKEEIEEETKKEAEQHLGKLVPEFKGERKREAVEALATTLQEEWMRSMEVEMKTGEEVIIQ